MVKPLDLVNLCYIWLKSYPALRRTWSGRTGRDSRPAAVNYGFSRVPGPDEHVFGGMVKLQDLNREFPHTLHEPDILYLVSSALPYFPVRMAEMAQKSGARLVVNQNGVAYPGWFGRGWQRQNRAMSRLHQMADHLFYQSEFCKLSADRFLGKRDNPASEILYNPVDTGFFRPAPELNPLEKTIVLLLSGSHWTAYRVMAALETLHLVRQENKQVSLRIAGRFCWRPDEQEAEQEVRDHARRLGLTDVVQITGTYSQDQAPAMLNSCSILLHTKYNDPCPRLVVEAMACGLPVVYSATGGVPELAGEDGGEGVSGPLDWDEDHPPDPQLLARAVLQVAGDLDRYRTGARQRAVKMFDCRPWLDRHGEVFNGLLEGTGQGV
jgi:glycosyltransferase involved in cell wall biosynthesis